MGYSTDFSGSFEISPPLRREHADYLRAFAGTRRMDRDPLKPPVCHPEKDPVRISVGLPTGSNGQFFVGGHGFRGQNGDASVLDQNNPPPGQPGLWCQWVPSSDGTRLEWDGGEKFYYYVEWLRYLVGNFLKPWGYVVNGMVEWEGEDRHDWGRIVVSGNSIKTQIPKVSWQDDQWQDDQDE